MRINNADPSKTQWSIEDIIFIAITAYNNSIHTSHNIKPVES